MLIEIYVNYLQIILEFLKLILTVAIIKKKKNQIIPSFL
jgi:hypothetical protein